jgi:hypothetical protein
MKNAQLHFKATCAFRYGWAAALLHGLLFFALVVSAGAHPLAPRLDDSGADCAPFEFVSASEATSHQRALTTSSGQRVARTTTKHDQLKLSLNQSKLAQARFEFPRPATRFRFATCEFCSYHSFRLSSFGGRGPPAAN